METDERTKTWKEIAQEYKAAAESWEKTYHLARKRVQQLKEEPAIMQGANDGAR